MKCMSPHIKHSEQPVNVPVSVLLVLARRVQHDVLENEGVVVPRPRLQFEGVHRCTTCKVMTYDITHGRCMICIKSDKRCMKSHRHEKHIGGNANMK